MCVNAIFCSLFFLHCRRRSYLRVGQLLRLQRKRYSESFPPDITAACSNAGNWSEKSWNVLVADKPGDATYSLIEPKNFGEKSKSQKQLKEGKKSALFRSLRNCDLFIWTGTPNKPVEGAVYYRLESEMKGTVNSNLTIWYFPSLSTNVRQKQNFFYFYKIEMLKCFYTL